jgi:hypothetical protein
MQLPVEIVANLFMSGESLLPLPPTGFNLIVSLRGVPDIWDPAMFGILQGDAPIYTHFPLIDAAIKPSFAKSLVVATEIAAAHTISDWKTLIHCEAGHNRSGYMTAFYLVKKCGYDPKVAIQLIRSKILGALTNQTFVDAIMSL